jgi:hypothetical protein
MSCPVQVKIAQITPLNLDFACFKKRPLLMQVLSAPIGRAL